MATSLTKVDFNMVKRWRSHDNRLVGPLKIHLIYCIGMNPPLSAFSRDTNVDGFQLASVDPIVDLVLTNLKQLSNIFHAKVLAGHCKNLSLMREGKTVVYRNLHTREPLSQSSCSALTRYS